MDDTTNTDNSSVKAPAILYSAIKSQYPDMPEDKIAQAAQKITDITTAAGHDITTVPPQQLVGLVNEMATAHKASKLAPITATAAPVANANDVAEDAAPGAVANAAQPQGAPSDPINAAAGNPNFIKQAAAANDPALYNSAADELYRRQGGDSMITRGLGGLAAAAGAYGGNQNAVKDYNDRWNAIDTAHTTGKIKEAADLANKGLGAVGTAVTAGQGVNASQSKVNQDKADFLQAFQAKGLTLDQGLKAWDSNKHLFDPDSSDSTLAQKLTEQALGLKSGDLKGHTAFDLSQTLKTLDPAQAVNKQAFDQLSTKFNNDTARLTAAVNAHKTNVEAAGLGQQQNIVGGATGVGPGGAAVPTNPVLQGAVGQGGPVAIDIGPGGASLHANAGTVAGQTGAADLTNKTRADVTAYQSNGTDQAIDSGLTSLRKAGILQTGKAGTALQAIPSSTAQKITQTLSQLYRSQGLSEAEAQARAANDFTASPKLVYDKLLSLKSANAVKTRQLKDADAYKATHNGSLDGFTPGKYVPYYNPANHDVRAGLPEESGDAASHGYKNVTNGLFGGGQ